MAPTALSLVELNRALLARQHLLERTRKPIEAVVEHLVGLQAQEPLDPYVGLFSRIKRFNPMGLGGLIEDRKLVRMTLMRGTIHLVTAEDAHSLRPLVQPAIDRVLGSYQRGFTEADLESIAREGRRILSREALTHSELVERLAKKWSKRDPTSLGRIVQVKVPLVQTPPRGVWGKGGPSRHRPLDVWVRRRPGRPLDAETLVLRYLAAFGPASVMDMQAWSGLTRMAAVFERLEDTLDQFTAPGGQIVFDLPEAPRPSADTPAPPRFLPVYENLVLGYRDRSRVVNPKVRWPAIASNTIVRFVLVDGVLGAKWRIEREKTGATLSVEGLVRLSAATRKGIKEEGERLLEMMAPEAKTRRVVLAAR